MIVWGKVVHLLFWCEPQIVTFWNYTFSWNTFFLLQEINVVHISDVVRPIFCLFNDTTFIKIHKEKVVQIFCLMWTTYCRDFEEDFQLIFMNHIRLLIRNQCGSHIIHAIPNPLAFQQSQFFPQNCFFRRTFPFPSLSFRPINYSQVIISSVSQTSLILGQPYFPLYYPH